MASIKVSNGKETFEVDPENLDRAKADGFVPTLKVTNGKETYDVHPNDLAHAEKDGFKLSPSEGAFEPETNEAISGMLADAVNKSKSLASPREALKFGANLLPTAGMMAGGVMGGGAGFLAPVPGGAAMGAVGGAGLGAAGGEALKQVIEKYLLGEKGPESWKEYANQLAGAGVEGMKNEMLGQVIAKPMEYMGGKLSEYHDAIADKIKENAPQIREAAKRLGFEPTQAMLSENPTVQKLESALSQSPRFTATEQRKAYENVGKGFERAAENVEALKSGDTNFQLGKKLGQGLTEEIKAAKAPVSELYKDINKDLLNIKLQPKIINQNIGVLKRDPDFKTQEGEAFLNKISNEIKKLNSVADLKNFRTNLLERINKNSSEYERKLTNKVYDQITNLRDASIQALKETDPFVKASGKTGQQVIDELHHKLALADAEHASNMNQLQQIKEIAGFTGPVKSQNQFLRSLKEIPEEKLIEKAANTSIRTLNEFKTQYPALYENAKQAKINDLIDRSMLNKGFNLNRFIKAVDQLEPEVQQSLFSKDQLQMINDIKLINKENPIKSGPSGTPEGLEYMSLWDPRGLASDIARRMVLKQPGLLKSAGENLSSPAIQPFIKSLLMQRDQNAKKSAP